MSGNNILLGISVLKTKIFSTFSSSGISLPGDLSVKSLLILERSFPFLKSDKYV